MVPNRAVAGTGAAEKVGHVVLERELPAPSAASRGPFVYTRCSFWICAFCCGFSS